MEYSLQFIALLTVISVSFPGTTLAQQIGTLSVVGNNEYTCTRVGFFPHPTDRRRFYQCSQDPTDGSRFISQTHQCNLANQCFDDISQGDKCTVEACSRNMTEEFACLKQALQQDAQKTCFEETLTKLDKLKSRMVQFTAHRGDNIENLKLTLRDLNLEMRENYAKMIENTGKNALPLMVATDGEPDYFGVGGVFKVYLKDGTMKRIAPVGKAFEMHKALAHIVLGVFSIISPYFLNPISINWQRPLMSYSQNCKNVQFLMERSPAGPERTLALNMLNRAIAYMDSTVNARSATIEGYQAFANSMAPLVEQSMGYAARAHARDTIPALQALKAEMGEEEWRKLHVIIPTVWPVSLFNIRLQALEKVMSFEQIKEQVLIVEGARTEAEARTTLGRVVADRAVAQLVWGGLQEETMKDHVFSLSTRRDLLSSTATKELNKVCSDLDMQNVKPKCPFSGRTGNVQAFGIQSDTADQPIATMLRH